VTLNSLPNIKQVILRHYSSWVLFNRHFLQKRYNNR